MKTIINKTSLVLFSILSILLFSCTVDEEKTSEEKIYNFDFKTTKKIKVSVSTLNSKNQPMRGVPVQIYTQNPLTFGGLLKENSSDFLAFTGISSNDGTLDFEIAPATSVDSLSVLVNHIGFPLLKQVKINSSNLNIVVGSSYSQKSNRSNSGSKIMSTAVIPDPVKKSGYYVLGPWDNQGKPGYLLSSDDNITSSFLADVNASLPEFIRLPVSHPEYLSSIDDGNIELIEDAEVWVTFVHEGAGYRNALGYYTHQNGNPPASAGAIRD